MPLAGRDIVSALVKSRLQGRYLLAKDGRVQMNQEVDGLPGTRLGRHDFLILGPAMKWWTTPIILFFGR